MIKIQCPQCSVTYNAYKVETKEITCQDCGFKYHQGFASENMPQWIKLTSVKLSKTLDFWKGL